MAKTPKDLLSNFEFSVSAQDLAGPVTLPGYLDDDPVLEMAKYRKAAQEKKSEEPISIPEAKIETPKTSLINTNSEIIEPKEVQPENFLDLVSSEEKQKKPRRDKHRLQINISADAERKLNELVEIISVQGPQEDITVSEILQALLHNLYDAKSDLDLSRLPIRGKWGTPTARSFKAALAEAFREALVVHDKKIGGNPFKKAVGS
jgi:hypothetical protein